MVLIKGYCKIEMLYQIYIDLNQLYLSSQADLQSAFLLAYNLITTE